jgi:hypothetical protein
MTLKMSHSGYAVLKRMWVPSFLLILLKAEGKVVKDLWKYLEGLALAVASKRTVNISSTWKL